IMLKKWSGYLFLSILSFGLFTGIFHTVANAEGSPGILAHILPSPTPTITLTPTPTNTPTPTPTNTPTPTPTETPTPTPTAIPTDTPTPTPIHEQAPQPNGTDLDRWFDQYASQYAIDRTLLHDIAACESGFNTNANFKDMYVGMYQFGEQTWISTRTAMGADPNPALRTNAEESIKTAAFKISQGGAGAWPNCL
ncbi:MAG TPA: transglycosylase family protein, partial [Patescibacteria group bacterium]|nr:transglycosylase family protein [Patescibacteria group bacterium]